MLAIEKQNVDADKLTIHSDRGPSMTSHSVAQLLAALGVTKSHSRPQVSNDNPFSESQFRTLKYRPEFPERFGGYDDARSFCRRFFRWYNQEHYHSGIGLLTPAMLHDGHAAEVIQSRRQVLEAAYAAHPERFVRGRPSPPRQPAAVWINPPNETSTGPGAHEKGLPEIQHPRKPVAPLAHPRPGYPSSGCVPTEPDSVSPDGTQLNESIVPRQPPLDTRVMPQKIPGVWGQRPQETPIPKTTELIRH